MRVLANGAPAMFPLCFQECRPRGGGENMLFHDHYSTYINNQKYNCGRLSMHVRGLVRLEGDSRRSCVAGRVITTADNVISASDRQLLSYRRRLARIIRYVTATAQVQSMIMFVKILIQEQNCIEQLV